MNQGNWEVEEEIGLEGKVKLAWCKLCEDFVCRTKSEVLLRWKMEAHEKEHEEADARSVKGD